MEESRQVQLMDIPSHVSPTVSLVSHLAEAFNKLANETNNPNLIEPSLKRLVQQVKEQSKTHLLQQVIQDRVTSYPLGPLTGREVMQINTLYKEEQDRMAHQQGHGDNKGGKIDHQKYEIKDGPTSMFNYEQKQFVTIQFEMQITEKLFEDCKKEYQIFNEKYISKIPTFFKIINKAEYLGIPRAKLMRYSNVI